MPPEFNASGESGGAGSRKAEPIRFGPPYSTRLDAQVALQQGPIAGRAGRIFHDPLRLKKRIFLAQNSPENGASPLTSTLLRKGTPLWGYLNSNSLKVVYGPIL